MKEKGGGGGNRRGGVDDQDGHDEDSSEIDPDESSGSLLLKDGLEIEVPEGDEAVLECRIQSNPAVTQINWFFNDQPLSTDPFRGMEGEKT